MTATLDTARRLSQEAFVTRDRLSGGLAPAKRLGSLEPGATGACRVSRQDGGGSAQRIGVAVRDQLTGIAHDLRQAWISERRHPAAAPHPLQAWQPQTLVP